MLTTLKDDDEDDEDEMEDEDVIYEPDYEGALGFMENGISD